MSAVLRLLSRSSVTNDIFRCIRTKSPGVLQQMRCRTSSASGEFSTDSRLLIGGGVCVVGAALAAYQLGVFNIYNTTTSTPIENEEKSVQSTSVAERTDESSVVTTPPQQVTDTEVAEKVVQSATILPKHVPYVLIGGGTASFTAIKAIQEHDPHAKILIICEEDFVPYMRPPLSKELWFSDDVNAAADSLIFRQWDGQEKSAFYKDPESYLQPEELEEKAGVAIVTGRKVVSVDSDGQLLSLDNGDTVEYNKLLIATGGRPKNLQVFENSSKDVKNHVTLFRDISDFRKLVKVTQTAKSLLVVGGGFLGSELACALGKQGKDKGQTVTQVFKEEGNMAKVLPKYLSIWTMDRVKEEGVDVQPKTAIASALWRNNQVVAVADTGKELCADHVIVAVGIDANTDLAKSAGLEIDPELGGYRVNSELGAASNIWVAGDASCFFDIKLGRRRVEHHNHAVVSGRLAGENMTGGAKKYRHQSMFWSDLGPNIGYEAIGLVDSSLPTVGVWTSATAKDTPAAATKDSGSNIRSELEEGEATSAEVESPLVSGELDMLSSISDGEILGMPSQEEMSQIPTNFSKGIIFYMRNKNVVGVILWNVFNRIPIARRIIDDGKIYDGPTEVNELAKAFRLYDEHE